MNIQIDIEKKGKEKRVVLDGEIDAYTAPKLRDALLPLTEEDDVRIIVDLTGVTYMDSTALGILIGAYKSCVRHDNHIKLTGMSERIERLFTITGLTDVMDIDKTARGEVK